MRREAWRTRRPALPTGKVISKSLKKYAACAKGACDLVKIETLLVQTAAKAEDKLDKKCSDLTGLIGVDANTLVSDAREQGWGESIRRSPTLGRRMQYYSLAIHRAGELIGFVRVSMSEPSITAAGWSSQGTLWALGLVQLLAVGLAS